MKRNRKAVVLLSGGLDSAVTLYYALNKGFICHGLIFDYGQRHRREIDSAKRLVLSAGLRYRLLKIDLPWKGSSLLDHSMSLRKKPPVCFSGQDIPATYVPARNLIFLSFAISFAEAEDCQAIFIGAHSQDYSGYPDCRPEFYLALQKVVEVGTKAAVEGKKIKILTPLLHMDKAKIIKLGLRLKVPFEYTWSCYQGKSMPCGRCDSCFYRAKGFEEVGLEDPLLKNIKKR